MKRTMIWLVLWCLAVAGAIAQQPQESVTVPFKNVQVGFYGDPRGTDAKALPLIAGRGLAGPKEFFGLGGGGVSSTRPAVELLDKDGGVLRACSLGELLSATAGRTDRLPRSSARVHPRWMQKTMDLSLPGGVVQLCMTALAVGDANSGQHLAVTFSLKSDVAMPLALRITLPVLGTSEAVGEGFVVLPRAGATAIACALHPAGSRVGVAQGSVVMTSNVVTVGNGHVAPAIWLVVDGVNGGSAADAKAQGTKLLRVRPVDDKANVAIVTIADKQETRPGDTVTYHIVCKNLGAGSATNIGIRNPVAAGTRYIEGSAIAEDATPSVERAVPNGPVRTISWTLVSEMKPGEERTASFKVIVQ